MSACTECIKSSSEQHTHGELIETDKTEKLKFIGTHKPRKKHFAKTRFTINQFQLVKNKNLSPDDFLAQAIIFRFHYYSRLRSTCSCGGEANGRILQWPVDPVGSSGLIFSFELCWLGSDEKRARRIVTHTQTPKSRVHTSS